MTLYRFYSEDNTLLYIGITINPGRRFVEHQAAKPWWHTIARITLEKYPDATTLADAERLAIAVQRPLYNVAWNDGLGELDQEALAEGCSEWLDHHDKWCPNPATHVTGSDNFVCATHSVHYTIAIPLPA